MLGPFTAEASAQFVVFPFTKIDTRAAMGLRLGPVEGRLGWRFTILDDQGRVDGVRNDLRSLKGSLSCPAAAQAARPRRERGVAD